MRKRVLIVILLTTILTIILFGFSITVNAHSLDFDFYQMFEEVNNS